MNLLLTILSLILVVALSVSENSRMGERFNGSMAQQVNFGGNYEVQAH